MAIPRLSRWQAAALAFTAVVLLLALEVIDEQEIDFLELGLELVEISLIVAASLATLVLFSRVEDQELAQQQFSRELAVARQEGAEWRSRVQDLMRGLSGAIDQQFDRWGFSSAEKDVALLLLKGFSHKEVAQLRGRSERTVRQQAFSLYRKANLSGRASLAAYFLEDLLLPSSDRTTLPDVSRRRKRNKVQWPGGVDGRRHARLTRAAMSPWPQLRAVS